MPEGRQHPSVVSAEAPHQRPAPLAETQHVQIRWLQPRNALVNDLADLPSLVWRGELHLPDEQLLHRLIAADAGEDEVDRRQHLRLFKLANHVLAPGLTLIDISFGIAYGCQERAADRHGVVLLRQ